MGDPANIPSFIQASAEQVGTVEEPETEEKAHAPKNPQEQKVEIKPEAWIESDDCTACNDCIDALSSVFKYNEDKQAYVHNPKGGPYAKIVAAAEKCPARCIHPGLPHDKNERDLEKWMKRAEKYN